MRTRLHPPRPGPFKLSFCGRELAPDSLKNRFFLKYETRDVVVLLGRGTGGVAEARDAVSAYQEPTPLYGFMKYRRRTVIIKYLPQDCSRLFKGRI